MIQLSFPGGRNSQTQGSKYCNEIPLQVDHHLSSWSLHIRTEEPGQGKEVELEAQLVWSLICEQTEVSEDRATDFGSLHQIMFPQQCWKKPKAHTWTNTGHEKRNTFEIIFQDHHTPTVLLKTRDSDSTSSMSTSEMTSKSTLVQPCNTMV